MKKRIALLLCCLAIAAFLNGCGADTKLPKRLVTDFSANRPDVLRLGLFGDALDLSPIGHHGEYDRTICNLVHAAPLRYLPDGRLEGDLFDSWVGYPDEKGQLIIDGIWKQNLRWHDGTSFDPGALAFTFAAMRNPANASPYAALASEVVEVSSIDRGRRVRIVFPKLSRRYLELLTAGLLPPHLLEGNAVSEARISLPFPDPDGEVQSENASRPQVLFTEYPVGLGPYRLANRKRGSFIELESVQQVASESVTPNFRRILVKCHSRLESLLNDFRQGNLDWMPVPSEIAAKIEELRIPDALFHRYPNPSFLFWGFNMRKSPFDQVQVRAALDESLDRNVIRSKIPYEGEILKGVPFSTTPLNDAAHGNSAVTADSPDIIKLLDSASIKDTNGDGKRDFNGKPFGMKILVNEENLLRKLVGEEISAQFKRAGVDATVEAVSWSEFLGSRLASDSWDSFLLSFQLPRAGNAVDLWHSTPATAAGSLNYCGISDPELDSMLDQLDRWPEQATPAVLLEGISGRLNAVRPGAFLFRAADVALWRTDLSGPETEAGVIDMRPWTWKKQAEPAAPAASSDSR